MPTVITVATTTRQPKQHRVKEAVGNLAKEVNLALVADHKFVVVTGEDGKKFTLKAKQIEDIKAVA